MTIDKSKSITIPQWLLSTIISVVTAIIVAWGLVSELRVKTAANEQDIMVLQKTKVSDREFQIICDDIKTIKEDIKKLLEKTGK